MSSVAACELHAGASNDACTCHQPSLQFLSICCRISGDRPAAMHLPAHTDSIDIISFKTNCTELLLFLATADSLLVAATIIASNSNVTTNVSVGHLLCHSLGSKYAPLDSIRQSSSVLHPENSSIFADTE